MFSWLNDQFWTNSKIPKDSFEKAASEIRKKVPKVLSRHFLNTFAESSLSCHLVQQNIRCQPPVEQSSPGTGSRRHSISHLGKLAPGSSEKQSQMRHDSHFCWKYGSLPPKRIANIFHLLCSTFCKIQHDIILHLRLQHIHHFRTFQNTPTWNSLKNAPGPVAWYHISGRIWNLTCTDWNILGNCHWPRRWKLIPSGFPKWHADVEFVHENTWKTTVNYLSICMAFIGYLGSTPDPATVEDHYIWIGGGMNPIDISMRLLTPAQAPDWRLHCGCPNTLHSLQNRLSTGSSLMDVT